MIKKKYYLILPLVFLILICFYCFQLKKTAALLITFCSDITNNKTDSFGENYRHLHDKFIFWKNTGNFVNKLTFGLVNKKTDFENTIFGIEELIADLPDLVGVNNPKTYFVLLQNNMELRPTGGFMGSYVKLKFKAGGLSDLVVQDIYVPDGQIEGHVDPPAPIQQAFGQGWFRLRDANWDPDFPTAAQTIAWFFEKGHEEKADGVIAVNLNVASELLNIIGTLSLPDYNLEVTKDNFYQIAQEYSEKDFFAGSTQKANIMQALVKAMVSKLKQIDSSKLFQVVKVGHNNLNQKQILVYLININLSRILKTAGWDGSLKKYSPVENQFNDYFYLVESNLGANKANLYVAREINQNIDISDKYLARYRTTIVFNNSSKYITPVKPAFWGGNYINYVRLYFPITADEIKVKIDNEEVDKSNISLTKKDKFGLLEVGFFVTTLAKNKSKIEVGYTLPIPRINEEKINYFLIIQKQPGITKLPFRMEITKNGKIIYEFAQDIFSDTEIKAEI